MKRRLTLVLLAVLAGPTGLAAGPAATASGADAAPALVGISYLNGPFAWVGWTDHPVARVELSSPAVGDTVITTQSSNVGVAWVAGTVVVPDGQTSADVSVTGVSPGFATLSATFGATTVNAAPDLEVADGSRTPELQALSVDPGSVAPGGSATGQVTLDFLAPPGGTVVQLTSTDGDVPATVTVAADQYDASFAVHAPATATTFTVSATLGAVTKTATVSVAEASPNPPPGPPVDTTAPDTRVTGVKVKAAKRKAVVAFTATEAGSTFECRLDGKAFRPCASPWTSPRLATGRHVFWVRARDSAGNTDASPARQPFRIKRTR